MRTLPRFSNTQVLSTSLPTRGYLAAFADRAQAFGTLFSPMSRGAEVHWEVSCSSLKINGAYATYRMYIQRRSMLQTSCGQVDAPLGAGVAARLIKTIRAGAGMSSVRFSSLTSI